MVSPPRVIELNNDILDSDSDGKEQLSKPAQAKIEESKVVANNNSQPTNPVPDQNVGDMDALDAVDDEEEKVAPVAEVESTFEVPSQRCTQCYIDHAKNMYCPLHNIFVCTRADVALATEHAT